MIVFKGDKEGHTNIFNDANYTNIIDIRTFDRLQY